MTPGHPAPGIVHLGRRRRRISANRRFEPRSLVLVPMAGGGSDQRLGRAAEIVDRSEIVAPLVAEDELQSEVLELLGLVRDAVRNESLDRGERHYFVVRRPLR